MRVCPQHVTQKHYLDEGGFGVIYAASVKLKVSNCIPIIRACSGDTTVAVHIK